MIDIQRQVKPNGACYYGAAMVMAAVDSLATFLTGQRYYLTKLDDRGFIVPEPVDVEQVYDVPTGTPASTCPQQRDD